jgi:hypothetical protein
MMVNGCCDKPETNRFVNHICIPNKGNPQYYDVRILYCKNCGSLKSHSNITHVKVKNNEM